jgi:alkylation response protein AidB-like acyl-CoA dehydrogenase
VGLGISDEHQALHDAARRFLEARCPSTVPRALLDADDGAAAARPPFWDELASLGWLGLHLPEAHGGQGYSLVELAVVLEELGRAVAPGPFLPTVLASTLILAGGSPDQHRSLLPSLADGTRTAAVAFSGGPVLGGAGADLLVVPSGERWYAVDAADAVVHPVPSVDATRRVATVAVVDPPASRQLRGLDRATVEAVAATLIAAECAGAADWCLQTASEYAKVREQFGRPIGQFQAVKHRCADMLVAVEQIRSSAWDAAGALSGSLDLGNSEPVGHDEAAVAIAVTGSLAPTLALGCAKDCIQVLGGVGFTWEHDAHLYLKRALAIRQLGLPAIRWRRRAARLAVGGARRQLRLELPSSTESQRVEVRTFAESVAGLDRAEQRRRVVDAGYFVPHWPAPWGRDAGAVEQLVIDEEFRRARIRRPNLAVGAWAAPTIVAHGTIEQQERWVRPTLLGEISWCQMFSEPGAGSDLASLTTKAVRTDAGWLLSGQKVWTSMAAEADWAICLARTNPTAPKHLGITYFIVDVRSPGIEIRPLRELTGFSSFNEVFLSDVYVGDDCVIGEVDGGWPLARTTLANERVAMGSGSSFGGGVEALLSLAGSVPSVMEDAVLVDRLGGLVAEAQTVALLGLRTTARAVSGAKPGPESSVRKLLGVEHDQRVQEFGVELLGSESATTDGAAGQWTFGFLANRCLTIAGGTSEVQRNVIAERLLGLPRDP